MKAKKKGPTIRCSGQQGPGQPCTNGTGNPIAVWKTPPRWESFKMGGYAACRDACAVDGEATLTCDGQQLLSKPQTGAAAAAATAAPASLLSSLSDDNIQHSILP